VKAPASPAPVASSTPSVPAVKSLVPVQKRVTRPSVPATV
jgi:hypothetical protein